MVRGYSKTFYGLDEALLAAVLREGIRRIDSNLQVPNQWSDDLLGNTRNASCQNNGEGLGQTCLILQLTGSGS